MPTIQREVLGAKVKYELREEGFFLGSTPSYSEAEKLLENFNVSKQKFLKNYQAGKIPIEYGSRDNIK